jgi:steroid delta-isomerase-like uncharacterized protein
MAQATAVPPQTLLARAKELIEAYNARDWNRVRAGITADFDYDEIATGRRMTGADATLEVWQGWARAFPDSAGTYRATHVADDGTVVLEVTWSGTHQGPLQAAQGTIAATGRRIEVPACVVVEMAGEKARAQRHYFDMVTLLRQIGVME